MKNESQGQKNQSQPVKQGRSAQQGSNHGTYNTGGKEPKSEAPQKEQGGYSSKPEQQETQREQENMHNERDQDQLNADQQNASEPQKADKPSGKGKTPTAKAGSDYARTAPKPGQAGRSAQR